MPVDKRALASTPEGTADLIIFDGVFERRVRAIASSGAGGRGHRPA
jgi:hypothetical protein